LLYKEASGLFYRRGLKKKFLKDFCPIFEFLLNDLQGSSPKVNISHRQTPNILKKKSETLVSHPRKQKQNISEYF